jgi:hypothetical protein
MINNHMINNHMINNHMINNHMINNHMINNHMINNQHSTFLDMSNTHRCPPCPALNIKVKIVYDY